MGNLTGAVRSGHICRKYMGENVPNFLRFNNGIAGGWMRDFIFIKDPQAVREIFEERSTKKPEKSYRVFRRLHGYVGGRDFLSFRSHHDEIYARTRQLAYQTLIKRMVDHYDDLFLSTTRSYIEQFELRLKSHDRTVDIVDEMHTIATKLLVRVGFDEHDAAIDRNLFESCVWMVNDIMNRPVNCGLMFLDYIPSKTNRQLWKYQKMLRDTILSMVHHKRQMMAEGKQGDDVISVLAKDERNTDKDLIGILGIFFFAGFDTTANTMAMLLYHLAINPEIQDTVRKDVIDTIGPGDDDHSPGNQPQSGPGMEQLFHCKFLLATIKEVLRMFPTVPMISREVTQTHTNGICPRFAEEDTFGIAINMFGLHYNPRGWSRPHEFLPERWLDPMVDAQRDPKQRVYCPFAIGKRQCLGRQFAYVEMLTVISMLLRKYRLIPVPGAKPNVIEGGTLLIHGLRIRLEPLVDKSELIPIAPRSSFLPVSWNEIKRHNQPEDMWMVIDGLVFDVTKFAQGDKGGHPGGKEILFAMSGADATTEFEFVAHSPFARRLLMSYCVGRLEEYDFQIKENAQEHAEVQGEFITTNPKKGKFVLDPSQSLTRISTSASNENLFMDGNKPSTSAVPFEHSSIRAPTLGLSNSDGTYYAPRRQTINTNFDDWDIKMSLAKRKQ